MPRREESTKRKTNKASACIAVGGGIGMAVSLLLMLILSAFVAGGKLPESLMKDLVVAASFVGAMVGGVIAVAKRGASPLPTGAGTGILMLFVIIVLSLFSGSGYPFHSMTIVVAVALIFGGAFGGVLVSGRKKRRK